MVLIYIDYGDKIVEICIEKGPETVAQTSPVIENSHE